MRFFPKKEKTEELVSRDKSPLGGLEPVSGNLKINNDGSISSKNLDKVLNSSVEFSSTLIDLAKAKRFQDLGYEGKYEDRFFEIPQINSETRRVNTITISYSKSIDHSLLKRAVSQGLLDAIKASFPVQELGAKSDAPLRYVAFSANEGRSDTDHITFGNYDKNIFTGIDVYVEDGGKVYLNGRYKLTIKFSSDAEKHDSALAKVIVSFANKITITKEDVLQEMINNIKKE